VSFSDEEAFRSYRDDEETRELALLRREVITRTEVWRGEEKQEY
jgi:hypothetical protein